MSLRFNIDDVEFNLIDFIEFNSMEDLLDTFDFTVTRFAFDGKKFLVKENAIQDYNSKTLRYWNFEKYDEFLTREKFRSQVGNLSSTDKEERKKLLRKRINKYSEKGFQADDEMLQFILTEL